MMMMMMWMMMMMMMILLSIFPRLISAVADWMSTILQHMVWP